MSEKQEKVSVIKVVNKRQSRVYLRRVLSAEPFKVAELKLESGANLVPESELELYLQNPNNERFFNAGMLEAVGEHVEGKEESLPQYGGGDLSKLSLKAALRTVKASKNAEDLKRWITQDGRTAVRDALIARHNELTEQGDGSETQESAA